MRKHPVTRREILRLAARGGLAAPIALVGGSAYGAAASDTSREEDPASRSGSHGSAEHCIVLWLGGGASQVDTWDPKRRGDPKKKFAGSDYAAIPTAIRGAQVCEHLRRSAPLLDRAALVRTLQHDVVDEHAAATNRMHTGRPTSGTVIYPSMGSVVSHELGAAEEGVPAYVLMGYPNLTRGPGFLGPRHSYIYLTDTRTGPAGLARPPAITDARQKRREGLLARLQQRYSDRHPQASRISSYATISREAFRLTGPQFMSAFELDTEPATLRESYGSEFGQRCLLARRLIQRGVRFIEVSHNLNFINGTGWDTHNEGQRKQHLLIEELDKAFSTLLVDLEQKNLLAKTLIVISTEFGRPSKFDGRGGRGHQSSAFSAVLAGGGLRTAQVVGETDEVCQKPIAQPVSVPDFFATMYAALGIDPRKELYAGDRPVPVTDGGTAIPQLFS